MNFTECEITDTNLIKFWLTYLGDKKKKKFTPGRYQSSESIILALDDHYTEIYLKRPIKIDVYSNKVEYTYSSPHLYENIILLPGNKLYARQNVKPSYQCGKCPV